MKTNRWWMALACVAVLAVSASAQFRGDIPRFQGVWAPKVGSGAMYQMDAKRSGKMKMEIAIVGEEKFEGKPGHWLEMFMPTDEGEMVYKVLLVREGGTLEARRIIMQHPQMGAIEFNPNAMPPGMGARQKPQKADFTQDAELVGTESVTVPAGTFTCQHYKMKDNSGEVWFSPEVSPYGLVKMTSTDSTMVLLKQITDAKTRVRGTPQKMEDMMRQRP
jgi:hypothetical protein